MIKNPRQKGSRNELKCKRELESEGWLCEKVKTAGKFQKSVDFFGFWDILSLWKNQIKFIQVKTNKKPPFKVFEEFAKEHYADNFSFELWVYRDRKSCRKF